MTEKNKGRVLCDALQLDEIQVLVFTSRVPLKHSHAAHLC